MRSALLLILIAACGDNGAGKSDGGVTHHPDSGSATVEPDAKVFEDAPMGAVVGSIADLRSATDGAIAIKVQGVIVTYVRGAVGSDPAGFTIQKTSTGPAIFVAIDPTTTPIVLAPGDTIDLVATMKATTSGQPRITAIASITRSAQGADLSTLVQDISAATDLLTAADSYDSELVTITGTLAGTVATSGAGFSRLQINTTGVTGTTAALQIRTPTSLLNAIDMTTGCSITVSNVTFNEFVTTTATNAEIQPYLNSEIALTGCAAPQVVSAVAATATTIKVTFSRNVDPTSILADGSQFTIAGLTVAANPTVVGKVVTLTTTAQTPATNYTVVAANTLKDLQGTVLATTLQAAFLGYSLPATAVINEVNSNIANGCDLVEIRVKTAGSLGNFKLVERDGTSTSYTFPASLIVAKNDFVVVHFSSASTNCHTAGLADELTSITQFTDAKNYATAWDVYAAGGLINTTNVISLIDPSGAIVDVIETSDGTTAAAPATLAGALLASNATQWGAAADAATFLTNAVTATSALGNSATLATFQRVNDGDTNAKADWSAPIAQTWGALNAGQAVFP